MSIFQKYDFTGNSKRLPGGVSSGTEIFAFNKFVEDGGEEVDFEPNLENANFGIIIGENIDVTNINKLKKMLGFEKDLQMLDTIVKKQKAKGKLNKEDFVVQRGILSNKLYFKICKFLLELLHDLHWIDFKGLGDNNARQSSIDIDDAFKLLKPIALNLAKVLDEQLDAQYPLSITLAGVKQAMEKEKLNLKFELDPLNMNKKPHKTHKTKKENKQE